MPFPSPYLVAADPCAGSFFPPPAAFTVLISDDRASVPDIHVGAIRVEHGEDYEDRGICERASGRARVETAIDPERPLEICRTGHSQLQSSPRGLRLPIQQW